jgi:hypothetical protein
MREMSIMLPTMLTIRLFAATGAQRVIQRGPRFARRDLLTRDRIGRERMRGSRVAASTDARQKGGSGLGLSIVKQVVTRLGGEVDFAPAPGGGTIFYLDPPRWDPAALA